MTDDYPTGDELPDDPITADDLDPFVIDGGDFESIDEFAVAEFIAQYGPDPLCEDGDG